MPRVHLDAFWGFGNEMAIEVAVWKEDGSCGYPLLGWVCVEMRRIVDVVDEVERKLVAISAGSTTAHDLYSSRCFPMGVRSTALVPQGKVIVSVIRIYEGLYVLRVQVVEDIKSLTYESRCFTLITYTFELEREAVWRIAEELQFEFDSNKGWAAYS